MPEVFHSIASKFSSTLTEEATKVAIRKLSETVTNQKELPVNLEEIGNELTLMNTFIKKIGTPSQTDEVLEVWTAQVQTLGHRVEDVTNKYSFHSHRMEKENAVKKIFSKANYVAVFNEIAEEIIMIEKEIENLNRRKERWLQTSQPNANPPIDIERKQPQHSLNVIPDDLVGIEENRMQWTQWLYSNQQSVASDLGGLGKSALVGNLYEQEENNSKLENVLCNPYAEPICLSLYFFKSITNGFAKQRQIGSGGYGDVYKGVLANSELVAVKKIKFTIGEKYFVNEVSCQMNYRHKNIVRVLGYCANTEGEIIWHQGEYIIADAVQERIICLEFMHGRSLRNYISDESSGLGWLERYRIIKGVCQGLLYLHVEKKITHLDLKPENILLDQNMEPKISDFGISRPFSKEQTRDITSKIYGTLGYIAPELVDGGLISMKSDIYSLGVIILETITGKRTHSVENVLENWKNRQQTTSSISQVEAYCNQINTCLRIGLDCLKAKDERPTIVEIVDTLIETGFQENETVASTELQEIQPVEPIEQITSMLNNTETGYQGNETISTMLKFDMDVHPTQSWKVTGHYNDQVCISDNETKAAAADFFPIDGEPVYDVYSGNILGADPPKPFCASSSTMVDSMFDSSRVYDSDPLYNDDGREFDLWWCRNCTR